MQLRLTPFGTLVPWLDDITVIRRSRKTDPSTSRAAAARSLQFSDSHEARIVNGLRLHGESTADRLSRIIGLTIVQIDRRVSSLIERGLIAVATHGDGSERVLDGFRVFCAVEV